VRNFSTVRLDEDGDLAYLVGIGMSMTFGSAGNSLIFSKRCHFLLRKTYITQYRI
jgi:hypothetical protein